MWSDDSRAFAVERIELEDGRVMLKHRFGYTIVTQEEAERVVPKYPHGVPRKKKK
jgi:hypothetical protein